MATATKKRRSYSENPTDALARIESGFSQNDVAVIIAFSECGIAPDDIDPRHNVLTYNAWKAKGRQVAKGATSVRVTVWIPARGDDSPAATTSGDGASGDKKRGKMYPKATSLFHISQTIPADAPKGTRPPAWNNPLLVKPGSYEELPALKVV